MVMMFLLLLLTSHTHAKDLGTHGHVYDIAEPDLLEQITTRLQGLESSGDLETHNKKLAHKTQNYIRRPKAVPNIQKATETREFFYDPSITVPYDLKDNQGRVFHKAGTKVNPLQYRSLTKPLIFIDGDDQDQLNWTLSHYEKEQVKIILISGSPFELMEELGVPVYFDQQGRLTRKFGIRHVPAVVVQEGIQLKVSEILMGRKI